MRSSVVEVVVGGLISVKRRNDLVGTRGGSFFAQRGILSDGKSGG